jgi:phage-related protein
VILELLWRGEGWPGLTIYGMQGVSAFIGKVADANDADAIDAMFEYVAQYGPPRIKSKCRPLSEKIFELKPGAVRLPFFYDQNLRATIVITHGFMKQGQKTPPRERDFAERQFRTYLAAHRKGDVRYEE